MNKPEIETLSYHSSLCKCPACGTPQEARENFTPIIEPKTRAENKESVGRPQQPKCKTCGDTKKVYAEHAGEPYGKECPDCKPEQPKQNAMIFVQVNGSITVAIDLLKQLESKDTLQEAQKQGCIWTLDGWLKNNLKHLQKEYE